MTRKCSAEPSHAVHSNWRRFRRNRMALLSLAGFVFFMLGAIFSLPTSARWYNVQATDIAVRSQPSLDPVVPLERFFDTSGANAIPSRLDQILYRMTSLFGHDDLGRSLTYRVLPGFLVSLCIGLGAALMATIVGTLWGSIAALAGGRIDAVMMRIVDVLFGLPYILMVILLKVGLTEPLTAIFGGQTKYADLIVLFVAIGGVSWLTLSRVVRGQVLSLREQPFIEAARATGAGHWHILRKHVFPNVVGPIAVYATLVIPQAIMQESFLSFLGIGVQQPIPSLGRLAADGVEAVNAFVGYWWLIVFPCTILVFTLLALNFIGDGLRDAVDPKSNAPTLV